MVYNYSKIKNEAKYLIIYPLFSFLLKYIDLTKINANFIIVIHEIHQKIIIQKGLHSLKIKSCNQNFPLINSFKYLDFLQIFEVFLKISFF